MSQGQGGQCTEKQKYLVPSWNIILLRVLDLLAHSVVRRTELAQPLVVHDYTQPIPAVNVQ